MEGISHRTVEVNGIKLHVAEMGEGPVVLFLHGFPELWYSWRHQIIGLSEKGYRAVAPDLRGFGDSDRPVGVDKYNILHVVGDLVGLIDALGEEQVFVVGHDWGAIIAWGLVTFRPDKVKALVNLSVAHRPRHPFHKPIATLRSFFGENYYIVKFQEPGETEAEFAKHGCKTVLRQFLTYTYSGPGTVPGEDGFGGDRAKETPLPSWLTEEDIDYYTVKFEKSGFEGPLSYYRSLDRNWELMAPWHGAQIKVPTKFIVGDEDLVYHIPGVKEYIHSGGFKKDVPFLQDVVVMKGVGHFINQEKPQEITDHIYEFIKKFDTSVDGEVFLSTSITLDGQ